VTKKIHSLGDLGIANRIAMQKRLIAFTLIELLVVIAILAILAALGLPMAKSITERGNAAKCLGNMRNIGIAALAFASDNNMKLPMTSHKGAENQWEVTLQPYSGNDIKFKCPSDPSKTRERSYAINDMLTPNPCKAVFLDYSYLSKIERPSETIYFAEASPDFTMDHFHFSAFFGEPEQVPPDAFEELVDVHRHGNQANYLFADCHAEMLSWEAVKKRLENSSDRITDPTR
jgi:prepilin-type processing-associated H-X9-DG protein/prepilin-type N-terminal cleavage/methylation domain-containing protein